MSKLDVSYIDDGRHIPMSSKKTEEPLDVSYIDVPWGEVLFSPVQYSSFRVGGYVMRVVPKQGESVEECITRAHEHLHQAAKREYSKKLMWFIDALHNAREAMRG